MSNTIIIRIIIRINGMLMRGAAVLSRVVLEIRVKLHGMNRVTQF
eukprot:COSAG02_NODE_23_length_52893_cov_58.101868_49_plen_45_part_00